MKGRQFTAEDRRLLHRIMIDFIIAIVLCIPIIICEFIIEPFQRGFFCSDETIRYPFRANTVTVVWLSLIISVLPASIVIVVEYTRYRKCAHTYQTRLLFGRRVPIWIVEFLKYAVYYIFGGLLTMNATELGKYTIGRLRPHFMSVCQPILADGSTCDASQNVRRYIEHYTCAGVGFELNDVRETHLSFPSGHSSLSFYTMVYLVFYLQYKFTWRGSKFSRYLLQFSLLMLAWFTALSRVMDNYHHWSDVLCGSLLGVVGAVLTAIFVVKDFRAPLLEPLHGLPRQDTTTTLDEMAATLPAFRQTNGVGGESTMNGDSNYQYCTKV